MRMQIPSIIQKDKYYVSGSAIDIGDVANLKAMMEAACECGTYRK
jgi:hypothetical protein